MLKALSFGAVIWDGIGAESLLGGDSLNVTANLCRLGAESFLLTRLGNDEKGRLAKARMESLGIKMKYVQMDPCHQTGYSKVILDEHHVPAYWFAENASDEYITVDEKLLAGICEEHFDIFWYSSYTQISTLSRASLYLVLEQGNFKVRFCDINIRREFYPEDMLRSSFRFADILKMNDHEAALIAATLYKKDITEEQLAQRIQNDFDIQIFCVTKGPKGCTIYDRIGGKRELPAAPFDAVDTVGAGDAFSAAFLMHYCTTGDPIEAARQGNMLGGFVASQHGAIPDFSEAMNLRGARAKQACLPVSET
jgi:fructokinase